MFSSITIFKYQGFNEMVTPILWRLLLLVMVSPILAMR